MGRGASPLRGVVRSSPKKPSQENMEGNYVCAGELTPTRKPLSSISEGNRNPLMSTDENVADALTPKGKLDSTTPKGKKRGGQCLFPLMENFDGVNGTPERQGNAKMKTSHSRHHSPVRNQSAVRVQDISPAVPGSDLLSVDLAHGVVGTGSKGQCEQNGAFKQGAENSNSLTPRVHRNERGSKHVTDCEPASTVRPNCNQNISATPAKSVTRNLKYGAAQGPVVAGSSTSRALIPLPNGGRNVSQGTLEQQFNLEEDPTFWDDHNVQVLIRTRPISGSEMVSQGFSKCLKQEGPHTLTWLGPPETRFTFDHVAGEIITQEKLFKVAGLPMVENCMKGYNSCMFAYGQTGSGKTHTMLGDIDHLGDRPSDNRGMTPRVFEYLFSRIKLEEDQRKDENLKFLTKCSFLEIYNEQITDLLEPTSTNLQMREDVRKGVYVENLTEVEVNSVQDVIQLLSQGSANRKVAATNMNRESSRSHSVFTCIIESQWERDSMTNIRFGRLNLVDLAGSERQKSSGAEGERLKEAASINKSLSTLGLVIMVLVDVANGKQRHVPYRDSKLTFLLQDSLGGNSKTTIIATVSPSSCNALETLSTLKFAQRAKLIRNTAVINEDASGDVKALRAQIQQMKEELDRLRRQSISRIPLSHDDFNPVRGSFDSWGDAHKFFGSPQVSSRKLRQMEAVVAGALRREQAADVATKRLAAEIEQLNRLVHQREADTQSGKMILRFREDKIRRLETLSKGLLSVDSYLADEKKMLIEELQLMREKVDRSPELTRFAMENIRLLDQIRSLQEFHEGGEKDVMLEEISNLRDQLLEVLDGKIAIDQGLVPLTTPQKKALAPELAAAVRENDLLRIEADNYRSEVEELRSNLSSSLESYSKMGRQVDELQELVDKLKADLAAKEVITELPSVNALELENFAHLKVIADLKLQMEQSEEKSRMQESTCAQIDQQLKASLEEAKNLQTELEATKEAFEAARALTKKLQSKEAALVGAQYTAAVKQIRLETEEMAVQQSQSLTNIQEMAVLFRMKEAELRSQLDDAQLLIQRFSAKEQERKSCGAPAQFHSGSAPNSVRAEDGSFERLQKAQEIEMRHAEEVMQLQLELESLEAVLDEERAQKNELEEKLSQFAKTGASLFDCVMQESGRPRELLESELETTQATLEEETSIRLEVEEKVAKLTQQLHEAEELISVLKAAGEVRETTYFDAVSRLQLHSPDMKSAHLSEQLDQEKALVEALENQHLYSIQEFETLRAEHTKVLEKLRRREERERILRRKIDHLEDELMKEQEIRDLEQEYADLEEAGEVSEAERMALEKKLGNAKRQLEMAHSENLKLKEEESEKDLTRCQAESETVEALTTMQAELTDLRAEAEAANQELAAAKETVSELASQLESVSKMLSDVKDENVQVVDKYESTLKVKDIEIEALRKDWQSATVKLIDYLAEGDQALNEASSEMEQIFSDYLPSSARSSRDSIIHSRTNEKRKAVEQLKQQLQNAQELAKDTEGRVRVLSETAFAMATAQAQETPQKVHRLSVQAAEAMEVLQGEVESSRQKLIDFEKNATVMSVLMLWLAESVEAKEMAGSIARAELKETKLVIKEKERSLLQEKDQSLLRESEEKISQLSVNLEEMKKVASERETTVAELEADMVRLQLALEALETERKQLVESKEKVEQEASATCSAVHGLKEELALTQCMLKEAEDKAAGAAMAHESLAIVKDEWEAEKCALQRGLVSLEEEKSKLEADMDALRLELAEVQARLDVMSAQLSEKEAEIAARDDNSEKMACLSIGKEEELAAYQVELELLRSKVQQKEALLKQAESVHLESVRASAARDDEREVQIVELKEQSETLSCMSIKKEEELCGSRKELESLQSELQAKQVLLVEVESKLLQTVQASDLLIQEKDEKIAALKEESERMSCMSVKKEDGEVVKMKRKLETLQEEIRAKERTLEEVERQLFESVQASRTLGKEKEEAISELNAEINRLSSMYAENSGELSRLREELQTIQAELEKRGSLLQESQTRVVQADAAIEKLVGEKEAIQVELETREVLLQESQARIAQAVGEKEAIQAELETREVLLQESQARVAQADAALEKLAGEKEAIQAELETREVVLQESQAHVAQADAALEILAGEKDVTQAELETREVLLQESQARVAQADAALEKLAGEKEAIRAELETREVLLQESQSRIAQADAALVNLAGENKANQAELDSKKVLLQESLTRIVQSEAALEKLVADKKFLESQLESMSLEVNVAASRLCEADEAQAVLQDKVAFIEARIVEYENKEQSLMMEVEELSAVRNMSDEDVLQLQQEVLELRRERDSLNLEVSTMDMQSAISDRLQLIQSMCVDTDDRITSMQLEIEDLTSAKNILESEVQSIEAKAADLMLELAEKEESLEVARKGLESVQSELMDATQVNSIAQSMEAQSSRDELTAAMVKLQAAEGNIDSLTKTIDGLNKSRADKEKEYGLLKERLEKATANRMQAQEKLDVLTVVMHEFSISEESWRTEKERILSDIETMKPRLAEKEAQCLALQEEKMALEIRLQVVAGEKDAALVSVASLENRTENLESVGKSTGKDASSDTEEVELAKARAALAGAEEKVKLLVDAKATMTDEWEGERSKLYAEKELLQLEISRLEKPVFSALDQNSSTCDDVENGKEHFMDELKQAMKRTSADCEKLRSKLRERDNTILSVKLELEGAMVHLKESNVDMEKTIREKEDALLRIVELEAEVTNAHEEIRRRREEVKTFELEVENVVERVTDSEAQWRAERDQLESERDDALAEAYEVECELRDQLELERDAARAEAEEFAAFRERVEETNKSAEKGKCSGQKTSGELEEAVDLSLESIAAFALVKDEVDLTKNHCEKEMETLAVDMKSLRADISSSFFEFPVVETREDVKSIMEVHRTEIASLTQKVQDLESLLAESTAKVSTLQAALENAQEVLQKSLEVREVLGSANFQRAADAASACADLENTRAELEMSEAAVSQLLAAVGERDVTLSVLESTLKETQERLAQIEEELEANRQEAQAAKGALSDVDQLRTHVLTLQKQVAQKEELMKGLEYDINLLEEAKAVEAENATKTTTQLQKDLDGKSDEVERLSDRIAILEAELGEKHRALTGMEKDFVATNANAAEAAVENENLRFKVTELEFQLASLDALVKEYESVVMSLKSDLETAQSLMAENEAVAVKARQSAEVFKSRSEEMTTKEEQLKNRVSTLQDQVNVLEKKAEEQCQLREQVEKELRQARQQGSAFPALESREAEVSKQALERKLKVMETELSMAHQRRENLQSQCDEKDRQIKAFNAQISQLTLAAGRHTSENQQKVRGLEAVMENGSAKSLARTSSMGPPMDFRNADVAARRRIEELEALAAGRLKEVYGLNSKIAELESEMHDVVRELVRTNLDVQNIKLNRPQVKEIVATVRRQSMENQKPDFAQDAELERLRKKLNEFIEERDSWLEEIQRKQAEMISARVYAEKMRFRDDILTAENEKMKTITAGLQKRIGEMEQEIKKLSGQQNLQQRIHHHAKIKDENNSLRLQVEDLGTKMRRSEMMFARVKDELERYRIAAGKTPFPNIDEEQRLRSKLQEAEESKIQLAQQFITLSNAIQQAAGNANSSRQVDQSAALEALRKLESRLRTAEDEVSEFKLKTRISGEKRRLSELRSFQTPAKLNLASAPQYTFSSPASYR